jgi:hypothetical protein
MTPDTNPFSTHRVRPGQLAFQFSGDVNARQLVDRLRSHGWWGQIIGPHGAGKSTLLHCLVPELIAAGRTISWWTLQSGRRRWPAGMSEVACSWDTTTLVVVDGYEQLSSVARWRLRWRCRATRAGLLITSHRAARLPLLVTLSCPLPTVQDLVARLLSGHAVSISPDEVSDCYHTHQGNVREVFFALYDLYEARGRRLQQLPSSPRCPHNPP